MIAIVLTTKVHPHYSYPMTQPVLRFAPSPNGELHLGHAYSALLNQQMANDAGGKLLLRIEDIDLERCNPGLEAQMLNDLEWLGIEWDGVPRWQSEHLDAYQDALDTLEAEGLVYPSISSRGEVRHRISALEESGKTWPRDPDGVPHYPGEERLYTAEERAALKREAGKYSLRLDMAKALGRYTKPLEWYESGAGPKAETGKIPAHPAIWGDVLLGRKDVPTSYHLACVLDDALQGVSLIVRGQDLFHATSIHRLLQEVLGLPAPVYHHHRLILDDDGQKLAKSRKDTSLRQLRDAGLQPDDIKRMVGWEA